MGGASAMSSLDRVIEAHGDEIRQNHLDGMPEEVRTLVKEVTLENGMYHIQVGYVFESGTMDGPWMDIDMLAEEYPDCDVGY